MNESQTASSNRIEVVSPGRALEANYFAAALSRELTTSPQDHADVIAIDGLRGCGGLDVVLDLETSDGVRWPSLRGARGSIDAQMLRDSLPFREGVAILSHTQDASSACAEEVTELVCEALSAQVSWSIETGSDENPPKASNVLVLVHGAICELAAAQTYINRCPAEVSVGLVLLETPAANRAIIEESLGAPVVAHAPTRWHMGTAASRNILAGRWPHTGDRAFASLVKDSAIYVRSQGRCLAWV